MKQDTRACPFCSGTSIDIRSNGIGDYFCICDGDDSEISCGARTSDSDCESQEKAVRRWNRREREKVLVDALQGLLDLGRKDTSNPKYDSYYEAARAALGER